MGTVPGCHCPWILFKPRVVLVVASFGILHCPLMHVFSSFISSTFLMYVAIANYLSKIPFWTTVSGSYASLFSGALDVMDA